MPENMMNSAHKATNKAFRDEYDSIFRKDKFKSLGEQLRAIKIASDGGPVDPRLVPRKLTKNELSILSKGGDILKNRIKIKN